MKPFVFRFERDDDPKGEWIPLAVRMKLDLAGLKISLADWQAFDEPTRDELIVHPDADDADIDSFTGALIAALNRYRRPAPSLLSQEKQQAVADWADAARCPVALAKALHTAGGPAWGNLSRFGRYALHAVVRKNDTEKLNAVIRELAERAEV